LSDTAGRMKTRRRPDVARGLEVVHYWCTVLIALLHILNAPYACLFCSNVVENGVCVPLSECPCSYSMGPGTEVEIFPAGTTIDIDCEKWSEA